MIASSASEQLRPELRRFASTVSLAVALVLIAVKFWAWIATGSVALLTSAVEPVRPKMMTVTAIMAGLLPILWSHGTGSELMQRIAVR